jgi:hypothetical protein
MSLGGGDELIGGWSLDLVDRDDPVASLQPGGEGRPWDTVE